MEKYPHAAASTKPLNYYNPETFEHTRTEACCTSETTALDESKCCVTCFNGNYVYNEISATLCFGQPALNITRCRPRLAMLVCTLAPKYFLIHHSRLPGVIHLVKFEILHFPKQFSCLPDLLLKKFVRFNFVNKGLYEKFLTTNFSQSTVL